MKLRAGPPPTRTAEPEQLGVDEIYRRFRRRARQLQAVGDALERAEMIAATMAPDVPELREYIELAQRSAAEHARRALFKLPQVVRRCRK